MFFFSLLYYRDISSPENDGLFSSDWYPRFLEFSYWLFGWNWVFCLKFGKHLFRHHFQIHFIIFYFRKCFYSCSNDSFFFSISSLDTHIFSKEWNRIDSECHSCNEFISFVALRNFFLLFFLFRNDFFLSFFFILSQLEILWLVCVIVFDSNFKYDSYLKEKSEKKYPRWIMNIKIVIAVWNLIHFFLFLLNDPSFENFSWNNIISFQVSFSILFIFFFILMNIKSMWSTSSSSGVCVCVYEFLWES